MEGVGRQRVLVGFVVGAVILAWTYLQIDLAWDDLWHYGVDRPSHAGLGQGLAALAALGFVAAVVAVARRLPWFRPVGLAATAAGAAAGAYVFWVGSSHSDKIGFGSGSLRFLGIVVIGYSAVTAWNTTRADLDI